MISRNICCGLGGLLDFVMGVFGRRLAETGDGTRARDSRQSTTILMFKLLFLILRYHGLRELDRKKT